ncbi:hypothetical protein E2C01_094619 [Portunus trituberculatus]|uniref:Uncharacterized protein n=1 Tax=Portunus trituberculatus TaxID=210409 RepID=A0A5B7JWL3_PORTR|nr:hypothetical protein [Portunus trituberculatus]
MAAPLTCPLAAWSRISGAGNARLHHSARGGTYFPNSRKKFLTFLWRQRRGSHVWVREGAWVRRDAPSILRERIPTE